MSCVVDIKPVNDKALRRAFLELPYNLYKDMPNWRAPLRFERAAQFSDKNPGRAGFDIECFLAMRGGQVVGRIAAFINPLHRQQHKDDAGHFGYFDCVAEADVAAALLQAAEQWLRSKGAKRMIGPVQWSLNEECGLLIDGFDTPPVVMMPHGRPDYKNYMDQGGFSKATDLLAFQSDLTQAFPRAPEDQRILNMAKADTDVKVRKIDMKNYEAEIALAMSIFNDAWHDNWGFVPFTSAQVEHIAKDMRPLIDPDLFLFGEIKGEAVSFVTIIPDINEAAAGLNGRLLPFGWAVFLYRLKIKGVNQSRLPLMGLRRAWHHKRKGFWAMITMNETALVTAYEKGFTHCELSWILEDNKSMITICEHGKADVYKTYRMYEKTL